MITVDLQPQVNKEIQDILQNRHQNRGQDLIKNPAKYRYQKT